MRSRIGTRLILGAGLATALAIGGMAVAGCGPTPPSSWPSAPAAPIS